MRTRLVPLLFFLSRGRLVFRCGLLLACLCSKKKEKGPPVFSRPGRQVGRIGEAAALAHPHACHRDAKRARKPTHMRFLYFFLPASPAAALFFLGRLLPSPQIDSHSARKSGRVRPMQPEESAQYQKEKKNIKENQRHCNRSCPLHRRPPFLSLFSLFFCFPFFCFGSLFLGQDHRCLGEKRGRENHILYKRMR
nr:hypothetical protein [Pandoravirus aubagnensis]